MRCAEFHEVYPGGALPQKEHFDGGSLVTVDIMLADPDKDFTGGTFQTLEKDGSLQKHEFKQGDAVVFVSHKYHCVAPVTGGRRNVVVIELWQGEARHCAHRCMQHWGRCEYTKSFDSITRFFENLGGDDI